MKKKWYAALLAAVLPLTGGFAWADNAESLLWRVGKNGETAGWLAGTLHAGKAAELPAGFQTALQESGALVLETESVRQDYYRRHPQKMLELMLLIRGRQTLAESFGADKVRALQRLLAGSPLTAESAALFEPKHAVAPWFAALMTGYAGLPDDRAEYGIDSLLLAQADRQGKPMYGLEDGAAVLRLYAAMPDSAAKAVVDSALKYQRADKADSRKMLAYYCKGEAAGLWRFVLEAEKRYLQRLPAGERETVRRFDDDILLAARNRNWLPALDGYFSDGKVKETVAVGALHLFGRNGLVALLREQGWTVEAVPSGEMTAVRP